VAKEMCGQQDPPYHEVKPGHWVACNPETIGG